MKAIYRDADGNWVEGTVTINGVDLDELPDNPFTRMVNASECDLLDRYRRGEFDA